MRMSLIYTNVNAQVKQFFVEMVLHKKINKNKKKTRFHTEAKGNSEAAYCVYIEPSPPSVTQR